MYSCTHTHPRITRIHKESLYISKKKTDSAIVKWVRDLNKHFTKKDIYRTSKYMKRFL